MKSKLDKTDKLTGEKNDVQNPHATGSKGTNWNAWNFKIDNGTKTKAPVERFDWQDIIPDEKDKKKKKK